MLKPREKFKKLGIAGLTTADLIAILLGTGSSRRDVFALSKILAKRLAQVKPAGVDININNKLMAIILGIHGIGEAKAMRILSGIELGARIYQLHTYTTIIKSSQDVINQISHMKNFKQEHLIGLLLNARLELIKKVTIAIGTIDQVNISTRNIITKIIETNATSIILAHNHPSGDPTPSQADISITKNLQEVLKIVDTNLLDHIIIASRDWFSMRDHNIL